MRVLIVTNMYPSPAHPALGSFVRDQVEALAQVDDLEVELFAFEPGGARAYARAAARLRRRFAGRSFDVIHAHYGLAGWVSLVLRGAPHIVTLHGTDLEHARVGPLSRVLARVVSLPAPVSAELARAAGVGRGRRVAVLPCGVDLERFRPLDRREARRHVGLDADGRYLLFPADPGRREKRYDRAQAVARALGGPELLTYAGADPAVVPYLINAANAVVAPSEREGFGLAPLESLACDVPIVTTDVGIAPFALRGVAGTLSAPFDVDRFASALAPHVDSADPRVEGRARAGLFECRRLAARVSMAYRDVADRGSAD